MFTIFRWLTMLEFHTGFHFAGSSSTRRIIRTLFWVKPAWSTVSTSSSARTLSSRSRIRSTPLSWTRARRRQWSSTRLCRHWRSSTVRAVRHRWVALPPWSEPVVLKLYHPWPFLNFCDHIRKHDTKIWGNFILTIAQTVLLLFNFILQYILWAPHDHWVLKYHTLTNTALLFNFILQYILWAPHDHWVLKYHTLTNTALLFNFILQYIHKYHTLTNTALLFNFILQYILWAPHDHWVLKFHTLTNTGFDHRETPHLILLNDWLYKQGKNSCAS